MTDKAGAGFPTHSRVSNVWETMDHLEATSRVPHTFAGFEWVGDHGSVGGDLAETGRYDNSSYSFQRQQ